MKLSLKEEIINVSKIKGQFTLRSGKVSDTYFDKYQFETRPHIRKKVAGDLAKLIPTETEVLAGLEMGGIPIATALSLELGMDCAFIRKEAKTYGTCQYAEGVGLVDKRVVLVEDVVSSGGAIIDAIKKLRSDNVVVSQAFCVIDRGTGGLEKLKEEGIELISLFNGNELNT